MSTTYSAGVILGVKIIDIGFKAEFITTPYVVHDKKGNPTGKIDNEHYWKFNFQGTETIEEEEEQRLHDETIEEIIGLKKPLEIFNINSYYENNDIDKVIIGVSLTHKSYDDYHYLEELNPNIYFELIKSELNSQFGVDVDPKLFFYSEVS